MTIPGFSESAKDKADGGKMQNQIEVSVGNVKDPAWSLWKQQFFAYTDFISAILLLLQSIISIIATWPLFSMSTNPNPEWRRVGEFLTDSLISATGADPTDESTFQEAPGIYWSMVIHLGVLNFFLYRFVVTYGFLQTMIDPNVLPSSRLKNCRNYILCSILIVTIYSFGLVFSIGIQREDKFRLAMEILSHAIAIHYVNEICKNPEMDVAGEDSLKDVWKQSMIKFRNSRVTKIITKYTTRQNTGQDSTPADPHNLQSIAVMSANVGDNK